MSKVRILVAEDDANIRNGLMDALTGEGYAVTTAADGTQAWGLLQKGNFELAVLDVMMPGRSGFDLCRDIRAGGQRIGIILLTAKGEEIDKVVGLQLGADDYVTKPFGVRELLARVQSLLRRLHEGGAKPEPAAALPATFSFGDAEIDTVQFRARSGRETQELTAREVELVRFFKAHPNEVLSRDRLLNAVWGIEYYGTTRTLDQHIAQLRKKIACRRGVRQPIETVHGVGYRYSEPP